MRFKILLLSSFLMCLSLYTASVQAQTIEANESGTHDGYYYQLWKDYGDTTMVLKPGGSFSCEWSDINNALFSKGLRYDRTMKYDQLGNIKLQYGANFAPDGVAYLGAYGWTTDPLREFYIVDSWGTWRPPGRTLKGSITVDGATYDIYNYTLYQEDQTRDIFWSVRTEKRTSGTISVFEHFKAWEELGMETGNLAYLTLSVEGYQSSGSADVYYLSFAAEPDDNVTTIPAQLEAEKFSGINGIMVEPCGEGGLNIGYIEQGDWIEYRINVPQAGLYTIMYRLASQVSSGSFNLLVNGSLIHNIQVPNTNDWQTYETLSRTIELSEGEQTIRLEATGNYWNLNWINFEVRSSGP